MLIHENPSLRDHDDINNPKMNVLDWNIIGNPLRGFWGKRKKKKKKKKRKCLNFL